jgi:hypothetical protein
MWPFSNKDKQAESGGDDQAGGSGLRYDQVREAENKRYLNELINIRRSPDVQKRLLEVLKYEPSLTKRIDIVERLDRLGVETLNWYEQRISLVKAGANKSQNEKNRKTAYFFQSPEYRSLSLESKVLLRGLEPPSLISFITKEYRRISAFGKREHLLKSSVFRMRHAPDAMLLHWCNGEMPIVCSTLEHTLSRVVERGWATLDIRSYNILVCLESLVQGWISEAPRMTAQTPSRLLWLKIGPLARTWFSLTKADDQISQALDGLAQFLKANGADGPQIRRHLAAAEAILDDNRAGVGFARAVLAIWMLLARRFTTREALCDALKPEAIQTTTWACPPDVLEKINAFIQARRDERDEFVRAILLLDE